MGLFDAFLDVFRSPDPKVVAERIADQIIELQIEKETCEFDIRRLNEAIRLLNERIRKMERVQPSLLGDIRALKVKRTNIEYQILELRTRISKIEQHISQLLVEKRRLAA